jgi:hypothetical protein
MVWYMVYVNGKNVYTLCTINVKPDEKDDSLMTTYIILETTWHSQQEYQPVICGTIFANAEI